MSLPNDLLIQACRDLHAREQNHGSWPDGIPKSFHEIRRLRQFFDDDMWVHTVEMLVKREAVNFIAKATEV